MEMQNIISEILYFCDLMMLYFKPYIWGAFKTLSDIQGGAFLRKYLAKSSILDF